MTKAEQARVTAWRLALTQSGPKGDGSLTTEQADVTTLVSESHINVWDASRRKPAGTCRP